MADLSNATIKIIEIPIDASVLIKGGNTTYFKAFEQAQLVKSEYGTAGLIFYGRYQNCSLTSLNHLGRLR